MDEQVVINRVTTVEITLSREFLKPTESHTSQTDKAEIDYNKLLFLQVIPKTNFTVVGEDCLEIDPPSVSHPSLHYFDLRATHIGKGEVWIVVRQGQIPLNTIKLQPEIIHSRAEIRRVRKTSINRDLNLNANLNEPPNQLTIIERCNGQEIRYDYEFRSISLKILNRYESKPITSERYEYVENLYKEIENRWLSTQDDVDLFSDELRAFGGQLFDQLFPEELQKTLWEHHSTINSIMVISTEPFIPWELVHLKPPGQKNLPDETKFLGQMGLVRWLYDAGWPPESIQIRNQRVYCIIPQYPIAKYQLPQAQQECKLLVENFQAVLVEPQQKPVLDLIKASQFDLLHFAGHGVVDPKNMTSSKLMLEGRLEGNQYIKNYLNSTIVEQFFHLEKDENRPMIILNACQVGQSSYALTGMSGFAQAFLKGGAGVFVGPLWSVGDRPARIFIESLYRELINGLNLSEATSLARNTAKQTGDATWLAYSVYGHPHLRFISSFSNAKLYDTIQSGLQNPQIHTLGIQGLGGTGKSTIASYLYQNTDFAAKFWADVSLNPDFTVFAEKVIIALGGKVAFPIDITELINNLLQLLSQHRCLLVIDNLETLIDVEKNWQDEYYQQFFNRWLQQGKTSTLLITTREKPQSFQGLEHWYSLGGMKIAEGITLLTKLGIRGTETETELEDFVRYVDGHPLTIKLVAGYLREYCGSQLSQVAELGLEQFDLVYKEAAGLHRNKQDARLSWLIQQHLNRLTPEQKNFLIDLSVYRLPFDREAASYIMAGGRQPPKNFWKKLLPYRQWFKPKTTDKQLDIVKALQELCNRSLLTKTEDNRYLFQTLVREYLYQQEKRDLTTAHQQAIQYYQLHLKEERSWQVREDVSEYLEIVYHCCELKQYASADDILNICFEFLNLRGYYSVLVELYERLISGWQENLQPEDRSGIANSLGNLGLAYYSLGDYPRAIDYHQQSLAIQREIGNRSGIGNSLNNLGLAYYSLGDYPRAIDYHHQSLAIQREIGNRFGIANSLGNLGNVYYSLGEHQRTIDYYQQSLAIQREIGNRSGIANSLGNLGLAYYSLGDYPRAIDYHQQSLAIQREIGNRSGIGNSLNNLGLAYYSLGDYPRAIDVTVHFPL